MKKQLKVDDIPYDVVLTRRKGTKNIKIALKSNGTVLLSVPHGVSEAFAIKFLRSKSDWILAHATQPRIIENGTHIGKAHRLTIELSDITRPSTKITNTTVRVRLPLDTDVQSPDAQKTIKKACDKALMQQAKKLLPQRLEHLADKHNQSYTSVTIKKLTSRWGSCDTRNNLVFNSYLMQYDWKLIDYVICHELAHTVHHDHSPNFWAVVESMLPDYAERRKELKTKQTNVIGT